MKFICLCGIIVLTMNGVTAKEAGIHKTEFDDTIRNRTHLISGITKYYTEKYFEALGDFKIALKENPFGSFLIYRWIGNTMYDLKMYDSAEQFLDKALLVNSNDTLSYFWRASARRLRPDKVKDAIDDYNILIKWRYVNSEIYFDRGYCFFKAGDLDKAMRDFEYSLKLKPKMTYVIFNIGLINYSKDRSKEAIANFSDVIAINPDALSYYYRGLCYLEISEHDKSISDIKASLALGGISADAYSTLGLAYAFKKDSVLSDFNFKKAFQLDSQRAETYFRKGRAEMIFGRPLESKSYLQRALVKNDGEVNIYLELGKVEVALSDTVTALKYFERGMQLKPGNIDIALARIVLLQYTKTSPEILNSDFSTVLDYDSNIYNKSVIYLIRSFWRLENKDSLGALSDANRAVALTPKFSEALLFRAFLLLKLNKDFKIILDDLDHVNRLYKNIWQVYGLRAIAYANGGQFRRAVKELKHFEKLGHTFGADMTAYITEGTKLNGKVPIIDFTVSTPGIIPR